MGPMPKTPERHVTVTPQIWQALRACVESGEFATVEDALEDAVRLWQHRRMQETREADSIGRRLRTSMEDTRPSLSEKEADREMHHFIENRKNAVRHGPH
ncbi:type II toxin-antitoxin system ParD family antitoxin [Metarhizobium album]|uniref:Type II toxin-antitoxin system ParD family antitoxin n=2 Tax=Metarhizobium album TaxID=2182425 RepID=A0A2U2DQI1_9HYPH|nr:type II toxin-antitoxin system ParD family antitoxin [Rhizobium album]